MRLEVAYMLSQIACVVYSSRMRLCSLFLAPNCTSLLLFLSPLLVDLVSLGLASISTDLVSVTVSGEWLPLAELPWIPAFPAQGLWLKAHCLPWNHCPPYQAPPLSSSSGDESVDPWWHEWSIQTTSKSNRYLLFIILFLRWSLAGFCELVGGIVCGSRLGGSDIWLLDPLTCDRQITIIN